MVKTPHFHCRLHGFDPWLVCEDPICHGAQPNFLNICVLSRFSRVPLFVTPWTVACQPSLSIGFPRQEYWSGLLCPLPGDLPKPGIEPTSLNVSCIGRRVLYHEHHLGSSFKYMCVWVCVCVCVCVGLPGTSDYKESACQAGPLGTATHSNILVWRIPVD